MRITTQRSLIFVRHFGKFRNANSRVKREPRNRPRRAHRVSVGIAQLFLNLGTRGGFVVSITPRPPLPRKRPGTHCTGGWVGPGAGLGRCGESRPAGIRSSDLPARSETLYRLIYSGSPNSRIVSLFRPRSLSTESPLELYPLFALSFDAVQ
jgi:hypothetical protein